MRDPVLIYVFLLDYDEDDDGFLFTRVKKQKTPPRVTEQPQLPQSSQITQQPTPKPSSSEKAVPPDVDNTKTNDERKRKRLSFSTPNPKGGPSVRRSKRLSRENEERAITPVAKPENKAKSKQANGISVEQKTSSSPKHKGGSPKKPVAELRTLVETQSLSQPQPIPPPTTELPPPVQPPAQPQTESQSQPGTIPTQDEDHSATKIALPFADTPVIKRNKAMREGKSGKGERRSSLGFRGRRASSLIETGNSNGKLDIEDLKVIKTNGMTALPHSEVQVPDFYKHIESEGLLEPRRMRQLLTWCATRALDEKPMGTDFEDSSARSAGLWSMIEP